MSHFMGIDVPDKPKKEKKELPPFYNWLAEKLTFFFFLLAVALHFCTYGYIQGTDYALSMMPAPINIIHATSTQNIEHSVQNIEQTAGTASWYDYCLDYGPGPLEGMCNEWSKSHNTAASRTLPRYSHAKVTNPENGKSVIVYINDYGPQVETGREIDLSSHAFSQLAPLSAGLVKVIIEPYVAEGK